jgi:hypothetical protein
MYIVYWCDMVVVVSKTIYVDVYGRRVKKFIWMCVGT